MSFSDSSLGRIDRIIIQDFKSYAGSHVIGPFKTFTSIIGPNGAGKSNLMDAISFVLGVRSTVLRGSQLRDLINRQEEAEAPSDRIAYVELIFIKGDMSELKFRRTITPSGSCEYNVNKRNLSAANYNKALEDINILVQVRNFLVFQGDVESISRKSPKELTALFEELSGSIRFKAEFEEKKELKEKAEEDFVRMFDKKRTINKEKKQLKEQKVEADKFNDLQGELAAVKLESMLWKLYQVDKDMNRETKQYDDEMKVLDQARVDVSTVEKRIEDLNQIKGTSHKDRIVLEKKYAQKSRESEKKSNGLTKTTEQISYMTTQIDENNTKLQSLENQLEKQKNESSSLQKEIRNVESALELLLREEEASEHESGELRLQAAQVRQYNSLKSQAGLATASITSELDRLKVELKSTDERVSLLESNIATLKLRSQQAESNADSYQSRKSEMQKVIADTESKLKDANKRLDEDVDSQKTASTRKEVLDKELEVINRQLADSKADRRDNERDQKLNEAVEAMKRLIKGVRGRLIDLCKPSQRKYHAAVQVALGKNMDAVLVDNEKTAQECIAYLKEHHVGVATFIPIETIKFTPIKEHLRELGGTSKVLVDCVDYKNDESVLRALLYAVGSTILVDTLDEARKLCFADTHKRYKVVTLDGTQISKNGNITGGGSISENASSSSWDEREYQASKLKRDKLIKEKAELDQSHRSSELLQQSRLAIQGLENKLKTAKVDFQLSSEKLAKEQKDLKTIQSDLNKKDSELREMLADLKEKHAVVFELEESIREKHTSIFADFSRQVGVDNIEEYETMRLAKLQKRNSNRVKLTDQLSKLKNQLEYESSRDLGTAAATLKQKIATMNENITKLRKEQAKMRKQEEKDLEDITSLNEQVATLKKTEEDADIELKQTKKSSQNVFNHISSLEKNLITRDASIEKLKISWRTIIRQCELEQIVLPVLAAPKKRSAAISKSKSKVAKTKSSKKPRDDEENEDDDMGLVEGDDQDFANIDFSQLLHNRDIQSIDQYNSVRAQYEDAIVKLQEEIESINPNLKASEKFKEAEARLNNQQETFEKAREDSKTANELLESVKQKRMDLFQKAFVHVSSGIAGMSIDFVRLYIAPEIYKMLTSDSNSAAGGNAFLTAENEQEPFLHGIKYQVIPPSKRFRDMELLSGGEKSVASLALLFAMHSFRPTPFFVLDEIDAALDPNNVHRVSNYIRGISRRDNLQCIVISLKDAFYEKADALIGVYRDKATNTSGTLTLDLTQYDQEEEGDV